METPNTLSQSNFSKLPKSLTTVTPFSKFLAAILFIIFPILGFYLGIQYERNISVEINKAENITTVLVSPSPQISPVISPSISFNQTTPNNLSGECHQNDKYFVITNQQTGNFLIKTKATINQKFECKYLKNSTDYEIINEGADQYYELKNNYLFIDTGTGPGPRGLTIYDLNNRQEKFTDSYNRPLNIQNSYIEYWKEIDTKVSNENCHDKDSWEKMGLGTPAMEEHIRLDLSSFVVKSLNETRCSSRQ